MSINVLFLIGNLLSVIAAASPCQSNACCAAIKSYDTCETNGGCCWDGHACFQPDGHNASGCSAHMQIDGPGACGTDACCAKIKDLNKCDSTIGCQAVQGQCHMPPSHMQIDGPGACGTDACCAQIKDLKRCDSTVGCWAVQGECHMPPAS